ncbi:hypothetical protein [Nocardia shimofusensis]|uniref:hypothetical protein n=1 Tax=Nocardia shimofusensis TaxID=228596 RepID=UPI000AFF0D9D|nr:hypothetical protein [Nocardia shimofusensis]
MSARQKTAPRPGRTRRSAGIALALCALVLAACSTPEEDPPETLTYRSVPAECQAITDQAITPIREFLADVSLPDLPGTLDEERTSKRSTPTSISCSTHQTRYGPDLTLGRDVEIEFLLATEPFRRPSAAVPVPLLGESAHQETGERLGAPGAYSRVVFRVRNLEVKVTANGDDLGPSAPDVSERAEKTALSVATAMEAHIDDLMPWPE